MKMILKVLALPLLFIVTVACILGNLITNISSYVIALLLLVIAGCSIYCIVKALWTSLARGAILGSRRAVRFRRNIQRTEHFSAGSQEWLPYSVFKHSQGRPTNTNLSNG